MEGRHTIVHGSYNVVNITGECDGRLSFMNSGVILKDYQYHLALIRS